eukprot:GHVP01063496.1.p1 GENE.GHVP01063496.1~~GHVP01063496.1.p1  ORF type:complete len:132 (+),score=16.81 GHVP01063496.1:550-945(+)
MQISMYPLAYEAIATTSEVLTPVLRLIPSTRGSTPSCKTLRHQKTRELLLEYRDRWETSLEGQCSLAKVDFEEKGDPIECKHIKLQPEADAEVMRQVDKRIARGNLRYDPDCNGCRRLLCPQEERSIFNVC